MLEEPKLSLTTGREIGERNDELNNFVLLMQKKGVDHEGVRVFGHQMIRLGAPEGFLGRLAHGTRYVSEEKLLADISEMAQRMKVFVGTNPYTLVSNSPGRSADFIYSSLLQHDLSQYSHRRTLFPAGGGGKTSDFHNVPHGEIDVLVDDWTIGADQIIEIARGMYPHPLKAFVLYRSAYAKARQMSTECPSNLDVEVVIEDDIPNLRDILTEEDLGFIEKTMGMTESVDNDLYFVPNDLSRLRTSASMLFGAHKVPDTVMLLFKGRRKMVGSDEIIAPLIAPKKPTYSTLSHPFA